MQTNDINIIQNKFHSLLEKFLYGSQFTKMAKIFFPRNKSVDLSGIQLDITDINILLNIEFNPCTNNELAEYLSKVYQRMIEIELPSSKHKSNIKCKYQYSENNYSDGKKLIINKLISSLRSKGFFEYLDLFLIHGSYSTLDHADNISDLDTLILLKDSTLLDNKKLLKLQEIIYSSFDFFYMIDLLQHHGYFVLTHFDLKSYNETFFPLRLFDYSTSIHQTKDNLNVLVRDNQLEVKDILNRTLSFIEETNPENLNRMMGYKVYFQVIQLIPIAYLQYKGKSTYKKYSFDLFLEEFQQYKYFFDLIYQLRISWKQNSFKNYPFLIFILPKRLIFFLNSKIEKVPISLKKQLGHEQHKNILKPLVKCIRKKIETGA